MNKDRIIERLKKILAHAENGVGEEKETAKIMLQNALSKYELTIENIRTEELQECLFTIESAYDATLLNQIIAYVVNDYNRAVTKLIKFTRGPNKGKEGIWAELKISEKIEIELIFSILSAQLDKKLWAIVSAIIQVNDIFPDWAGLNSELNNGAAKKLSGDELSDVRRAMGVVDKICINKAIENG